MTIATLQYDGIGARIYAPQGPVASSQMEFKAGEVVRGDAESEFVYVIFRVPSAPVTLNQGDVLAWDNSYTAIQLTTAAATRGMGVGTFYCGGRFGDPASLQGGGFSATFPQAGAYGVWVQRTGISLINAASTAASANLVNSTATAKQIDAPATATVGSRAIIGMNIAPTSGTFTANTVTGSNVLTNVSTFQGLAKGQLITGTGIPAGTTVQSIDGGSITMSNVATATGTGVTVTWAMNSFVANTTTGSNQLTGLSDISGVYPNQTLSGTGIPVGTTIVAINGNPGNYSITMSANATATGTAVSVTTNGYVEGYLRSPYIDKTN